jgi:DNA polymerase V
MVITVPKVWIRVPKFISNFQCGEGTPFADGMEYVDLPEKLVADIESPFIVEVSGDSMVPLLAPGDVIIGDFKRKPTNGCIVICYLNGNYLIKRLQVLDGQVSLLSANKNYPIINITSFDNFRIIGVAVRMCRNLTDHSFNYYRELGVFDDKYMETKVVN